MSIDVRLLGDAVRYLKSANRLVILAGAGMSADSGLPTFRDESGYWKRAGKSQFSLASYTAFKNDPSSSWKFYAQRIRQYRLTQPHNGYDILKQWFEMIGRKNCFVFTSNTDGHFLKAGFAPERIYECYGSTEYMYCSNELCSTRQDGLLRVTKEILDIIERGGIPYCSCGSAQRPHVYMLHIPAHHEHPFWFNVNTYSDRT